MFITSGVELAPEQDTAKFWTGSCSIFTDRSRAPRIVLESETAQNLLSREKLCLISEHVR